LVVCPLYTISAENRGISFVIFLKKSPPPVIQQKLGRYFPRTPQKTGDKKIAMSARNIAI